MGGTVFLLGKDSSGQFHGHYGAAAGRRIHQEAAAQMAHSFLHAQQAEPAHAPRIETSAVILNGDMDAFGLVADGDLNVARLGMPRGVV